ncbi:unnamed protein product [Boreogadus saida]
MKCPMSPLPGAFAGRSPRPAMEAGGAGKPGGQEERLPAVPRQWLSGAYGGDGGLERTAAARVEAEGGRRVSGISLPPRKRPACHPP